MPPTSVAAEEQSWNRDQLTQPVTAAQWRLWHYEQPAIVLGCSQRAAYERLLATLGGPPMEVLLRESGGGAVLTGPWMLGLSLALPIGHPWLGQGLLESYRHLGQLFAELLVAEGVPARALPPAELPAQQAALIARGLPVLDWACFGNLSPWEVVDAQGRKIVGLAQRRRQTGVLLVAGLLLTEPLWASLCDALGQGKDVDVLRQRTVSCGALADGAVSGQTLAAAVRFRLGEMIG
ncbi:MAG: ligase [Pseudomonadota bacterium]|jgi:lipoate-protein ligase A|nr:ligase [Pseudomonadota bacterium]